WKASTSRLPTTSAMRFILRRNASVLSMAQSPPDYNPNMSVGGRLAALAALMTFATLASAVNRCALPSGRILYTEESCESLGGKIDRPMRNEISVVPNSAPVRAGMIEEKSAAASRYGGARRSPSGAPIITLCYDPENIRREVTHPEVESALHAAVSMWN